MSTWSIEELQKIAETDDLHISPFREDGQTYGTPTWIWSVVVDDALYVRAYNGQNSRWSGRDEAEGRSHQCGRRDEGSLFCSGGRRDQRPYRRCL